MSKRKNLPSKGPSSGKSAESAFLPHLPSPSVIRETIESIVVAFVLAFLFRTFEAEAFVIPTGSMAPTLMGRHKDLVCPRCGFPYQVSASDEVDAETGNSRGQASEVVRGTCPMCRFTANIGPDNPLELSYPSYLGDRILVSKFAFEIGKPRRWDVTVFKYPDSAKTNFIKRMIGLPGETIRITHGDIYVKGEHDADFSIARKPPDKLLAMLQPVYDNDYVLRSLIEQGWPPRWQPAAGAAAGAWRTAPDYRSFSSDGTAPQNAWLRYQHLPPSFEQWQHLDRGEGLGSHRPRAELITDFTAYNTNRETKNVADGSPAPDADALGLNWVGDLAVDCRVKVQSPAGVLTLELVKGGRRFTCRIDVASGAATLAINSLKSFHPAGKTPIRGPGTYRVTFSNVDEELRLWIDHHLIAFDTATTYPHLDNIQPQAADLSPVGIATRGAALEIEHLRILRDLYYIAVPASLRRGFIAEYDPYSVIPSSSMGLTSEDVAQFFSDPSQWSVFSTIPPIEFRLAGGQYLMLGDNSARSKDSRLWDHDYFVLSDLLIGKALFIYWPHSWNKITVWGHDIPFPYFPNFARMRLVR
jgi:signal peptidase I